MKMCGAFPPRGVVSNVSCALPPLFPGVSDPDFLPLRGAACVLELSDFALLYADKLPWFARVSVTACSRVLGCVGTTGGS